jgi:hypothetical protein
MDKISVSLEISQLEACFQAGVFPVFSVHLQALGPAVVSGKLEMPDSCRLLGPVWSENWICLKSG